MTKKEKTDMIVAIVLIILSSTVLLMPILGFTNLKTILIILFSVYSIINLVQFFATRFSKDYEGLFTFFASLISVIFSYCFNTSKPFYLALLLLLWILMMSLIKLKKADYYHDRENKMWIVRIAMLLSFILIGLLTVINLYYQESVQILLIGSFFFIHGVLELLDPLTSYIMEKK